MSRIDAVCVGEVTLDLIQTGESERGAPVFEAHAGGAPLNVAVGLVRNGVSAAIWSAIGRDPAGEIVLNQIQDAGLHLEWLEHNPIFRTRLTFIDEDPSSGERRTRVQPGPTADHHLAPDRIHEITNDIRLLYCSGAALLGDLTQTVVRSAFRRFRHRDDVLLAFDPNIRVGTSDRGMEIRARVNEVARQVDVLQYARHRAVQYWGGETVPYTNIALVIETAAEGGAVLRNSRAAVEVEAVPAEVVDTTGAGDAFLSAVLAQVIDMSAQEIGQAAEDRLREWGALGARAAAEVVGVRGGSAIASVSARP